MDQAVRAIVGPMLLMAGYSRLKSGAGGLLGGLGMVLGTALTESAITRVCPLNKLMGIDSRSSLEASRDREECLMQEPLQDQKGMSAERSTPLNVPMERNADLSLPS
jgi:hypothetical protein